MLTSQKGGLRRIEFFKFGFTYCQLGFVWFFGLAPKLPFKVSRLRQDNVKQLKVIQFAKWILSMHKD